LPVAGQLERVLDDFGHGSNRSLVWSYHCFRGERWCNLRQERLKAKS